MRSFFLYLCRRLAKIHLVRYKGETPFFRYRKRNKLVNERFRAKVGFAGKILGNPTKPKPNEEQSNSLNAQNIDALMQDLEVTYQGRLS